VWPVALLVALIVAGCGVLQLGEARFFGVAFADDGDGAGLIVTVEDRTGRVVNLEVADQLPGGQVMEARVVLLRDPVEPDALVVGWLGGACDVETAITIVPSEMDRATLSMRTKVAAGDCPAVGIERVAVITLDGPVDLSRIALEIEGDG
jgi:hypothetical protein